MLCNWFKVDAISPVPLKGGLKKIPSEGRQRGEKYRGSKRRRKEGRKKGGKKDFLSACIPRGVWCLIMIEQGVLSGALLTNTPRIDAGEAPSVKPCVSSASTHTHGDSRATHKHSRCPRTL